MSFCWLFRRKALENDDDARRNEQADEIAKNYEIRYASIEAKTKDRYEKELQRLQDENVSETSNNGLKNIENINSYENNTDIVDHVEDNTKKFVDVEKSTDLSRVDINTFEKPENCTNQVHLSHEKQTIEHGGDSEVDLSVSDNSKPRSLDESTAEPYQTTFSTSPKDKQNGLVHNNYADENVMSKIKEIKELKRKNIESKKKKQLEDEDKLKKNMEEQESKRKTGAICLSSTMQNTVVITLSHLDPFSSP